MYTIISKLVNLTQIRLENVEEKKTDLIEAQATQKPCKAITNNLNRQMSYIHSVMTDIGPSLFVPHKINLD